MWQALGELLPIAVAVAFSSVPITVTILILLSQSESGRCPLLVGWVIGVAAVIIFSLLGASAPPEPPLGRRDTATALLQIMIGAALIVLGVVEPRWVPGPSGQGCHAGSPKSTHSARWFPSRLLYSNFNRRACCSGWPQGLRCMPHQ